MTYILQKILFKTLIAFFVTVVCNQVFSQKTNYGSQKDSLKIYGEIYNLLEPSNYVYIICANTDLKLDSTKITNNRYFFSKKIETPTLITLYYKSPNIPSSYKDKYMLTFISEPTRIKIRSDKEFSNSTISGSKANREYDAYKSLKKSYYQKISHIEDNKITAEFDKNTRDKFILTIKKSLSSFYINYIVKNKKTYLPLFIIDDYLTLLRRGDIGTVEDIKPFFQKLSPLYQSSIYGKFIAKQIDSYSISVGMQAPQFTQPDTSGTAISLNMIMNKGKYILIDFWASWCSPCRRENPNLKKLYNRYNKNGFNIVNVSIDTDKKKWLEAIVKDELAWMHLSDLKDQNEAAKKFRVIGVPQNFLLNSEGKIIGKNLFGTNLEKKLERLFE